MRTTLTLLLFQLICFAACCQQNANDDVEFLADQRLPNIIKKRGFEFYAYDNSGTLLNQPVLFRDIDLSSYELINANLSFSDKESVQKIVFAPLKLIRQDLKKFEFIRNSKLNLAIQSGTATIGFAFSGDTSSPFSKRSEKKLKEIGSVHVPNIKDISSFDDYKKNILTIEDSKLKQIIIDFDSLRLRHVFKYSIGYNEQLYSIFSASGQSNGFDSLNTFSSKSHTVSATASYSFANGSFEVTGGFNYIRGRKSAIEGSKIKTYHGPSLTMKKRLLVLSQKEELKKSNDYLVSNFIPSIDIGIAFEGKYFQGDDFTQAQDGIIKQEVITPFLDFKITTASQFRIGIPRTWATNLDSKTQQYSGATLQYSFKLVNLN